MATVHDRFYPAHQAQLLDALTRGSGSGLARHDPDDPPSTHAELDRGIAARKLRLTPEKTDLSQSSSPSATASTSRGCATSSRAAPMPDSAFLAYIRAINREPEAVERALNAA